MPDQDTLARFFELLLKASLRLDFITHRLASTLSIIESFTISEIAQHERTLATDLVRTLKITKSSVSKVLKSMTEKGWIQVQPSATDHRQKFILLSEEGHRIVADENKLKNQQMTEFVQALSTREQRDFLELVKKFADASEGPALHANSNDHPLRREIQRLTRITGFLGENLLETGMSYQRCEILFLCGELSERIHLSEINACLPYDPSVVSRIISDFEHAVMLTKSVSGLDKRSVDIALTAHGQEMRSKMIQAASRTLRRMVQPLPSDFLERLLPLLSRVIAHQGDFADDAPGGVVRQVHSVEEKRVARAVAMELLVRQNLHFAISNHSFAPGNIYLIYSLSGHAAGVIELRKHTEHYELLLWLYDPALISSDMAREFIVQALQTLSVQSENSAVLTTWPPLIELLSEGTSGGSHVVVDRQKLLGRAISRARAARSR